MEKSAEAFRTISEVAEDLDLPQHVLRFWETRFTQVRPLKRGGNRRYYRPADIDLLRAIRRLLYQDGYTIKGVQRLLKEQGVRAVADAPPAQDADTGLSQPDSIETDGGEASRVALAAGGISQLQALLAELAECERLLQVARRG